MVEEVDDYTPDEITEESANAPEAGLERAPGAEGGVDQVPGQPNDIPNPAKTPGEEVPAPEEGEMEERPKKEEKDNEKEKEGDRKYPECPECESRNFSEDEEKGELVCDNCGLVIDENRIDESPEWRAFDAEQRKEKSRAGAPLTYTKHDMGVSTEIGKGSGELYNVPSKKREQYYRIQKWHNRLTESKDRNLGFALTELNRLVSYLNLPKSVHEEVARLYEKAVDKGLVRGRSMESVVTALLYIVSREQGTPRTLDEIHEASGIDKREIGRTYRYVARELDLDILPAKPEDHIPRFAAKLDLSGEVQARARKIIKQAKEKNLLSGKGPTGIAAAALYIAAVLEGEKRTQREVADIVGVTEVTIRNRYKELTENLGLEEEIDEKTNN